VFFDTDTLILDELMDVPFGFDRSSASNKIEGTWPEIEPYGPGYTQIWKSLYDRFGLDFDSSMDLSQPDEYWRRYLLSTQAFSITVTRMNLANDFCTMPVIFVTIPAPRQSVRN
jgi:hypothetical protein